MLRQQIRCGHHVVVALSGGVDSVVLLDMLASISEKMQFTLSAVHVNHGISANADEWGEFCRTLCRSKSIYLKIAKLKISRQRGVSLEAAARDGRYQIFRKLKADYVALAQHLDDQAETLVLQLLRGAGVKGLGAMPVIRNLASGIGDPAPAVIDDAPSQRPKILRLLLDVSRREIECYATENALQWITDESNDDVSFDRNFLRQEFFPLLEKRYPSYRTTFLRASRHMAEASGLLDELAEADSKACVVLGKLKIEDLQKLSVPRAGNLLRYILSREGAILPSTAKLKEILRQLLSSHSNSKLHVVFGNAEVRCFKGAVYVRKVDTFSDVKWPILWNGEKQLVIADLCGTIRFTRRKGLGINLRKLMESPVSIRMRQGGECFRPDCNRPRRSLKNLLRETLLPPWEREALPLIFSGDHLVWVPGIGVDCGFQAIAGEPGIVVEWKAGGKLE